MPVLPTGWLMSVVAAALQTAADGPAESPDPTVERLRTAAVRTSAESSRPFDEPDAAAELAWRKRRGPTPGFDTASAYRRALEHMDLMPRFSTRLDAELRTAPAPSVVGLADFTAKRLLGTWQALGPGNIGGRTRVLVIHPSEPDTMYVGGVSGGLWKTVNGGRTWAPLIDRLANVAVNSMAMRPDDPDTLYIGTGEGYFREEVRGTWLPLRGAGIFVSRDAGGTWQRLPSTENDDFLWVNDLVISTEDPDRIYAATRTGVHLSYDGGTTWDHSLVASQKGGCLDLAVRDDLAHDRLFASCGTLDQATVYRRSMQPGSTWEPVLSEPGMGRTTLAIAPSRQNVIYALSASNDPGPGGHFQQALHAVYRSSSGGAAGSWQVQVDNRDADKLNTLLLTNPITSSYRDCGFASSDSWIPMGWYCNVIAVDPIDPDVVWAAGVDLFRSDNAGRDWGVASYWWAGGIDASFVHADQHAIVFHPDYDGVDTRRMFAANDGGVYFTDNPLGPVATSADGLCDPIASGVFFGDLNTNLGITQFYHGTPFPGGGRYMGGTQDNGTIIGRDALGHEGWSFLYGGDGGYSAVDPTDPTVIYVSSQRFGFTKSTNGGDSFTDATQGTNDSGFLFITPVAMDPGEPQRLWTGGSRVWRTDNGAEFWVSASRNPLGPGQVSAIAVAPENSARVAVGTTDGDVFITDDALSADGSTVWPSTRPRPGFVTSLTFEPGSEDVLYATYAEFGGPHVWRSDNGGGTWRALDGAGAASLPDIPVHSLVVDPDNRRRLYVGTDLGVFTSRDSGRTWMVENTGFANVVTEWLALGDGPDGRPRLFAFTHGRGAWRVDLAPPREAPRPSGGRVTP
jgi:photosystem II stability/assembly factor-like uncharacterized protein